MIPEGNLSEFSLPDLLQIISMEQVTGTLTLTAPGRQGAISATKGKITGAVCGPKKGEEAIYALFLWEDGAFGWSETAPAVEANIAADLGDLAHEGIARRDLWRQAKQTLPSLNALFRRRGSKPENLEGILAQAWDALSDSLTIGDLGRRLGVSPAQAASALIPLWTDSALEAEIPPSEAAWIMFSRLLAEMAGRFADISGLRMTESFEAFVVEHGALHGLDLQFAEGRLKEVEAPAGDSLAGCKAVLSDVMEYVTRLHGAAFVERVVSEVARSATPSEQSALQKLGLASPVQVGLPGDGQ